MLNGLRRKQLPVKFAYTGDGARAHVQLSQLSSYRDVTDAAKLEAGVVGQVVSAAAGALTLIDVGPGDGSHTSRFIRALKVSGLSIGSYVACDVSEELLDRQLDLCAQQFPELPAKRFAWDIESGPAGFVDAVCSDSQGDSVLALLGSTIGNVESPANTLANLRSSCRTSRPILVVSAKLFRTQLDLLSDLAGYENETFAFAATASLRSIGIAPNCGLFSVSVVGSSIVGTFELERPVTIRHDDVELTLTAGTRIRCFKSRRFRESELRLLLGQAGWNVRSYMVDEATRHIALVATARPRNADEVPAEPVEVAKKAVDRHERMNASADARFLSFGDDAFLDVFREVLDSVRDSVRVVGFDSGGARDQFCGLVFATLSRRGISVERRSAAHRQGGHHPVSSGWFVLLDGGAVITQHVGPPNGPWTWTLSSRPEDLIVAEGRWSQARSVDAHN